MFHKFKVEIPYFQMDVKTFSNDCKIDSFWILHQFAIVFSITACINLQSVLSVGYVKNHIQHILMLKIA